MSNTSTSAKHRSKSDRKDKSASHSHRHGSKHDKDRRGHGSHSSHSSHKYRNKSLPKTPSELIQGDKYGNTDTEIKENQLVVPTTGAGLLQWDRNGFCGLINEPRNPMYKTTTTAEYTRVNSMPQCVRGEANEYYSDNAHMFQTSNGAELASVRTAAKSMEHLIDNFEPWRQYLTEAERALYCEMNPSFSLEQAFNAVKHGVLDGLRCVVCG